MHMHCLVNVNALSIGDQTGKPWLGGSGGTACGTVLPMASAGLAGAYVPDPLALRLTCGSCSVLPSTSATRPCCVLACAITHHSCAPCRLRAAALGFRRCASSTMVVSERSQVEIGRDELLIVNAALNEVCNGIAVFEFEARVGADRERAAALLKKLAAMLDKMGAGREPGSGCEHGPQRLSHRSQCRRGKGTMLTIA